MKMTEWLSGELEREAASSRRVLERVPEGRNDWKPHEKSMQLGYLAALVATMPAWINFMVKQDSLDLSAPDSASFKPLDWKSRRDLIEKLDKGLAEAKQTLAQTNDDHLLTNWKFMIGGHVASEQPRYIMIQNAVLSHMAHHRGQLTVYLRLNDAPVPAIYGPSADER
jgi:uncharacterized damage-inducible protein DinB